MLELITHGSKLQLLCTYLNKKTHEKKIKKNTTSTYRFQDGPFNKWQEEEEEEEEE